MTESGAYNELQRWEKGRSDQCLDNACICIDYKAIMIFFVKRTRMLGAKNRKIMGLWLIKEQKLDLEKAKLSREKAEV